MERIKQADLAKRFHELHQKKKIFLLPYAWNGGSARIFEGERFEAVSTTSAGIAYSMGYPDGEKVSIEDVVRITKEIVGVVDIPVSVDMELGYGNTPEEVKKNVRKVIEAGAVGVNIEDGNPGEKPYLEELDIQVEKIKALKELRDEMEIPFFINARTCIYWLKVGSEERMLEEAVKRGNAFLKAGGDCVFIPGEIEYSIVEELVKRIEGPVNLIVNPLSKEVSKLERLGVVRLCMGSGASRAVFEGIIDIAAEYREKKTEKILETSFSYNKANNYFKTAFEYKINQ